VTNTESWDRIAARTRATPQMIGVRFSPDGPDDTEVRLVGDVTGRRVLDLGCGSGGAAVALAQRGAHVIGVDASAGQLTLARELAEVAEVRIDWRHSDLGDLVFLRADSVDLTLSTDALGEVADIGRVFRNVHRVLRPGAPFVLSYEHPLALLEHGSYLTGTAVSSERDGEPIVLYARSFADVFTELTRSGFGVETIVEPRPRDRKAVVPRTIVWRARKEGM